MADATISNESITLSIQGSNNVSNLLLSSSSGSINSHPNANPINTTTSNTLSGLVTSLSNIDSSITTTDINLGNLLTLCQEISTTVNETEIVWNTSATVPGLNTSMPTLRTTDTDIVDTSNVLADLVEIDEMWVNSILDNNQNFLSAGRCMCCNDAELYGTSYTSSAQNVAKKPSPGFPGNLQFEKFPRSMHGFSSLLTMKKTVSSVTTTKYALYDFGANAAVLRENFASLKITELSLNDLIISHWHQDHTTEDLIDVVSFIHSINGNTQINLYFSGVDSKDFPGGISGEIIPKNTLNKKGFKYSLDNPTLQQLQDISNLTIIHTTGPRVIMDGWLFLNNLLPVTANDISNGQTFVSTQQRPTIYNWMSGHKRWWNRTIPDASWSLIFAQKDDQCAEDTYVACNVKNHGYGLFTGCGHAGIVNIFIDLLSRDALLTKQSALYFVFGGLHLDMIEDWKLKEVVYILKTLTTNHNIGNSLSLKPLLLSLSHCSSSYRVANMFEKFGENDRVMCAKITSTGSRQKYGITPS